MKTLKINDRIYHKSKIEWGKGVVVSIDEEHVVIDFEFSGIKKFKLNVVQQFIVFHLEGFAVRTIEDLEHLEYISKINEEERARLLKAEETARKVRDKAESDAKKALLSLSEKYNVPKKFIAEKAIDKLQPLVLILLKIESGERINEDEINWIEQHGLFNVAATILYIRFKNDNNFWNLVKVFKYLRKANLQSKAIELYSNINLHDVNDKRILSALNTTIGGSYRDLNDLSMAKQLALNAINLSPNSYHPHNLLGGILFQEGDHEKGQYHFDEAILLGSSESVQNAYMETTLRLSSEYARKKIIEFLLIKDSQKYSWVSKFL